MMPTLAFNELNRSDYQPNIYLFKVNNRNNWKNVRRSGVFIINFEHISDLFVVFLLLTLNM